jgi:hypothetical protein
MPAIRNHRIVHALVTATLGLSYAVVVVFLASFLSILGRGSGLAVSVSTLLVAALLWPAWRRIQGTIDRRFNRLRVRTSR